MEQLTFILFILVWNQIMHFLMLYINDYSPILDVNKQSTNQYNFYALIIQTCVYGWLECLKRCCKKKKERKRLLKKSYFYFFPPSIVSLRHSHWMILHHTFYIQFQHSKSMQEVETLTISVEKGMDGGGWLCCQTVRHTVTRSSHETRISVHPHKITSANVND